MSCCNNPDIRSSTYSDWCENCGWSYNYTNNVETGSWIPDKTIYGSEDQED